MNFRFLTSITIGLTTLCLVSAQAQGLKPSNRLASPPSPGLSGLPILPVAPQSMTLRQADFIVAIVNSEPITNHQVNVEVQRTRQQLANQGRTAPEMREMAAQVLERLINERAQLQQARDSGIKVEESSIDQAVQSVARQNKLDLAGLKQRLTSDGIEFTQFRTQLRDQLMLTRLREREVESRIKISDLEVEQYLKEQQDISSNPANVQIHLAQVLIAVPEGASAQQLASLQAKAQKTLERARVGEDFAVLARELSDAPDRDNGGQLGLRTADRYPQLFLDATQSLGAGGVSGLVRSGAGFHILKVIEKRAAGLPPVFVAQNRARHILLTTNPQLSEAAAVERLNDFRKRIQSGQADFAGLARTNSVDASAAQGGELGWANPGQFVPEFEAVINQLNPGQVSEPLISRFGVHLIQLLERRNAPLEPREHREMVRNLLRDKKFDETYNAWARDVRDRAYVEIRETPQ